MDRYKVPANRASGKLTIKGSKFIAHILPVVDKETAEKKYEEIKKQYYDATHNCFAYRIDLNTFRYSDDGEPSGTAGKPIFQVLEGQQLFEVLCVVTRYFGGTKLGTGGLIRAYTAAVHQALKNLTIIEKVRVVPLRIKIDYALEKHIFRILKQFNGAVRQADYANGVLLNIELPESNAALFLERLKDLTNGHFQIIK